MTQADLQKIIEASQVELERLAAAAATAGQRWQELQAAASECAARLAGIESEMKAISEILARQVKAGGALDLSALQRLAATREQLRLEVPVRSRAGEMARAEYTGLQAALDEGRRGQFQAMTAAGRRAAMLRSGWTGS